MAQKCLASTARRCRHEEVGDTGHEQVNEAASVDRLRRHVRQLAGEIGERNVFRPGTLQATAQYIEGRWAAQGYEVSSVPYEVEGIECANLEATLAGSGTEVFVVGAHYDSVQGSPGANDNGSGVAALLEISRLLAADRLGATLRFVAFVNEEPPFFWWRNMGSMVYARRARKRGDQIAGMISLETIGYYSSEPRSQHYPPLMRFFYPDRGEFLGFVSNLRSRRLLRNAVAAFRAASDWPVQSVSMFEFVPGISWSDHLSFWRQGWPALMITDTAPYRYPWYHTAQDTPDKVDYDSLAFVTDGLAGMLRRLLRKPGPGQEVLDRSEARS
ncbi:MAG: M28 family peptidase [bacterium]|nr:M28 family peptidase [bacterium]